MVCKEDVLSWFKELESYKRIDLMCSLLNMCLPFELRFAGTYVEDLGRRDFQELRGAELRANNADELSAELRELTGHTDPRAPRRTALYVSLLRSCNHAAAHQLARVLRALESPAAVAAPDELLLLYCMALNHPAFTSHQRRHFGDVLVRLQHAYLQGPPVTGDQMNEMVNTVIPVTNTQPINEPLMSGFAEHVPPPSPYAPQYNVIDFNMPGHWPEGIVMPEMMPQEMYPIYTPALPSPTSQPSSPCDSRPVSPNVQVPPPPLIPGPRVTPRQSQDTILMPPPSSHDPHLQQQLMANFNNLNINDIRHMEDERLHELGVPPNAVAQLRSLEKLNGLQRPSHSNKPPLTYSYTSRYIQHHPSSGSESSSSTASHSPPDTPAPPLPPSIGPGRPRPPSSPQFQYVQQYPRPIYPGPPYTTYRPNYPPFAANGEAQMYGTQYQGPYAPVSLYNPQPKLSCWNCGSVGHIGSDCKEQSIEEMTRAGGYQLDYSTAPPDINDK